MKYLILILAIGLFNCSLAQINEVFSLDTSFINPISNTIGFENLQKYSITLNPTADLESEKTDSLPEFIIVDTISLNEFSKLKAKYVSSLNGDTNLVNWTDTSFIVHTHKKEISCRADKRDYSEFDYYLGYLESLQLFVISDVVARVEVGALKMIDKISGTTFYVVSPSDYPLDKVEISTNNKVLSAFVNDLYNNKSFISLFSIEKTERIYRLEDYLGIYISNSFIQEFIWTENGQIALRLDELNENNNVIREVFILIKIE